MSPEQVSEEYGEIKLAEHTAHVEAIPESLHRKLTVRGSDGGLVTSFIIPRDGRLADLVATLWSIDPPAMRKWTGVDVLAVEEVSDVEKISS